MKTAAGNTLMGMGTVFLVLIFISCIISLFGFIPKLLGNRTKGKTESITENTPVPVNTESENNLKDDSELIAVIAAAIAASEQTSTDSFVVRSIRRR